MPQAQSLVWLNFGNSLCVLAMRFEGEGTLARESKRGARMGSVEGRDITQRQKRKFVCRYFVFVCFLRGLVTFSLLLFLLLFRFCFSLSLLSFFFSLSLLSLSLSLSL